MRRLLAILMLLVHPPGPHAQPADCAAAPGRGLAMPPAIPLALDLAGRRGVPAGTTGQAFVAIPSGPGGPACHDTAPPPADILRGEPGSVLSGRPSQDLLARPGTPHVRIGSP